MTKTCRTCGDIKPLVHFQRVSKNKDGRGAHCSECYNASRRVWNRENGHVQADYQRRSRYGISQDQYNKLLLRFTSCPVCGISFEVSVPCVDHDHDTGRVRGLLCKPCNRAIGLLGDDPDRLRLGAEYLEATDEGS